MVASGASVNGADILLKAGQQRAFRIRGVVVDNNGVPVPRVNVRAIPRNWSPSMIAPGVATDTQGKFEIVGVPAGSYAIRATFNAPNASLSAIAPVEIGSDNVDGIRLGLAMGATASGTIVFEGRTVSGQIPDVSSLRLNLVPENPMFVSAAGQVTGNSFTITGIQPGDYRFRVNPVDRVPSGPPYSPLAAVPAELQSVYVKSIRMGGEDVLERGLHLQGQPPRELEVVLGVNGGTVQGTVVDQRQQIVPNALIALVPAPTLRARIDLFKSATSDISGRFRLAGVAPGEYRLFAWKYVEEGRWYDPEFLSSVETRGKSVRISEGAAETVELAVLPEAQ
jgi:hypothetical protein